MSASNIYTDKMSIRRI